MVFSSIELVWCWCIYGSFGKRREAAAGSADGLRCKSPPDVDGHCGREYLKYLDIY